VEIYGFKNERRIHRELKIDKKFPDEAAIKFNKLENIIRMYYDAEAAMDEEEQLSPVVYKEQYNDFKALEGNSIDDVVSNLSSSSKRSKIKSLFGRKKK